MKLRKILDAIIVIAIIIIILLFVNPLLVSRIGIAGVAASEILMVMVAVAALLIRRDGISEGLSLSVPAVRSFFPALLLVLGANALQNAVSFFTVALTETVYTGDTAFLEAYFGDVDPYITLIVVALVPAVCEELIFRGYVLNAFKTKKGNIPAVVISAFVFSAIHFDLYKFLPLLIMGLAYGYIASATGSFLLGAIFHFINNALGVVSFYSSRGSSAETLILDIGTDVYMFYAVAFIGAGAVFLYYGITGLSGKQRKRGITRLVWIVSVILFVVGIACVTSSVMEDLVSNPYEFEYADRIREDVSFTESFDVSDTVVASVNATVLCGDAVDCDIIITDPNGEEVYDYGSGSDMIELTPGTYTVSYSFDVEDGSTVAHDVIARVSVVCVQVSIDTGTLAATITE